MRAIAIGEPQRTKVKIDTLTYSVRILVKNQFIPLDNVNLNVDKLIYYVMYNTVLNVYFNFCIVSDFCFLDNDLINVLIMDFEYFDSDFESVFTLMTLLFLFSFYSEIRTFDSKSVTFLYTDSNFLSHPVPSTYYNGYCDIKSIGTFIHSYSEGFIMVLL